MPLLGALGVAHDLHTTQDIRDAGRISAEIAAGGSGTLRIIVAGGDGTTHELMEGVLASGARAETWSIVVLPLGTVGARGGGAVPAGS